MLKFYSARANPTKVALFLEEAGFRYEAILSRLARAKNTNGIVAVNPNAKVAGIVEAT